MFFALLFFDCTAARNYVFTEPFLHYSDLTIFSFFKLSHFLCIAFKCTKRDMAQKRREKNREIKV
jgi:hypothetical protein